MVLSTEGVLTINGLAGSSSRFLKVSSTGALEAFSANPAEANQVLFGTGEFGDLPEAIGALGLNSGKLSVNSGINFGVGITNPASELDVQGNARITEHLSVEKSIYLGTSADYSNIRYIPATDGNPSILAFGVNGNATSGHFTNLYPGPDNIENNSYEHPCDPGADPPPQNAGSVALFQGALYVQKLSGNQSLGSLKIEHNGLNAVIESQGNNPASTQAGDLLFNTFCKRNIYMFDHPNFLPGAQRILCISGRVNVTEFMQLGAAGKTNWQDVGTRLFIEAGSSLYGIKLSDPSGNVKFSVKGDGNTIINGRTNITTTTNDAIVVADAGTSQVNFLVNKNGNTFLGGNISTVPNAQLVVAQPIPNYKAISLVDNGNQNREFFSVEGSGYTEIKVYNPGSMPQAYGQSPRAFTIRDMANLKDLFVVNADGKTYAREVEISLVADFPDYVFDKDYSLRPIQDVKTFIQENKHLPGFSPARHYEQNGMAVGDIILKQQEKIEEMMLYIIQLEERLNKVEGNK